MSSEFWPVYIKVDPGHTLFFDGRLPHFGVRGKMLPGGMGWDHAPRLHRCEREPLKFGP